MNTFIEILAVVTLVCILVFLGTETAKADDCEEYDKQFKESIDKECERIRCVDWEKLERPAVYPSF